MNSIKSATYKFVKTKDYLVHTITPLVFIILLAMYFYISKMNEIGAVYMFFIVFGACMPAMISIFITRQYETERKAGNFQNILMYAGKRSFGHIFNMIVLFFWGAINVIIAVMGMGVIMRGMGNTMYSLRWYGKMSIVLFLAGICWYLISYALGDKT